jgi:hypothetical protein
LQLSDAKRKALRAALNDTIIPYLKRARVFQNGRYGLTCPNDSLLDFQDIAAILRSILPFHHSIIGDERTHIASETIFSEIQKEDFTAESFIDALCARHDDFAKTPLDKYWLFTAASMRCQPRPPHCRRYDDVIIRFHNSRPGQFTRADLDLTFTGFNLPLDTPSWCYITAEARGRTPLAAGSRALDALNTWRALWNFVRNSSIGLSLSFPVEKPKNDIRIGPVHTVHHEDGSLTAKNFFYEPPVTMYDYPGKATSVDASRFGRLCRMERILRRQLRIIKYKEDLKQILREYVTILDSPSNEGSFIRLWTLLEKLTGGVVGKSDYDLMIKRVASVFRDRAAALLMLRHLKDARNLTTHELRAEGDLSMCFQQTLTCVHSLLKLHFNDAGLYESLQEVGEALSLASESEGTLVRRMDVLQSAYRLVGNREHRDGSDYSI